MIPNGAVAVSGRQIVAVGPAAQLAERYTPRERIDCTGCAVIPGLINGHAHVPMSLLRGMVADQQLDVWLYGYMFPVEAAAHCLSAAAALAALRGDDGRSTTLLGVADGLGARFGLQPEPLDKRVRALVAPALARLGTVLFEQRRRAAATGVAATSPSWSTPAASRPSPPSAWSASWPSLLGRCRYGLPLRASTREALTLHLMCSLRWLFGATDARWGSRQ